MTEEIKYNGHTLLMYTSIQDLPISRFQIYNRSLVIDSGIGSDLNDFDKSVGDVRKWIDTDVKKAKTALLNMQQLIHFVISNTNPGMSAFVALIRKIDGKELNDEDLTDEGVKRIIKQLGTQKLSIGNVKNFLIEVKKKWTLKCQRFFQRREILQS